MLLWVGPQIQAMLRSELTDRPSLSRPIASVRQEHQRRSAASPNRSFKAPRCTGRQAEVGNADEADAWFGREGVQLAVALRWYRER